MRRFRSAEPAGFGRTATPEFAYSTTTESVPYGLTPNPWGLERTAGGSSGGWAAAVAAVIVPVAHATDAAGSIRIPAASSRGWWAGYGGDLGGAQRGARDLLHRPVVAARVRG